MQMSDTYDVGWIFVILRLRSYSISLKEYNSPLYNHMGKADYLYFEVEPPPPGNQLNYVQGEWRDIFCKNQKKKLRCVFE